MNKLKHTKGPWEVVKDSWEDGYWDINSDNWGSLAMVVTKLNNEDSEEGRANARLIATAPEMLEFLIDLYVVTKKEGFKRTANNLKIVIEKATGEKIEDII